CSSHVSFSLSYYLMSGAEPTAHVLLFFFFSSRRRHTRSVSAFLLNRSSDLEEITLWVCKLLMLICILTKNVITSCSVTMMLFLHLEVKPLRSEERRVGKECRYRWSPYH